MPYIEHIAGSLSPRMLSDGEVAEFEREGVVVLRGLVPDARLLHVLDAVTYPVSAAFGFPEYSQASWLWGGGSGRAIRALITSSVGTVAHDGEEAYYNHSLVQLPPCTRI